MTYKLKFVYIRDNNVELKEKLQIPNTKILLMKRRQINIEKTLQLVNLIFNLGSLIAL